MAESKGRCPCSVEPLRGKKTPQGYFHPTCIAGWSALEVAERNAHEDCQDAVSDIPPPPPSRMGWNFGTEFWLVSPWLILRMWLVLTSFWGQEAHSTPRPSGTWGCDRFFKVVGELGHMKVEKHCQMTYGEGESGMEDFSCPLEPTAVGAGAGRMFWACTTPSVTRLPKDKASTEEVKHFSQRLWQVWTGKQTHTHLPLPLS